MATGRKGNGARPLLGGSKNAVVMTAIARELLDVPVGERIKTTSELAAELAVGQGTVQKAIRSLEESEAVRLTPRGHLGTFLEDRNLAVLWRTAGLEAATGLMALPDSKALEGIATALYAIFKEQGIPLNLSHLPGSTRRTQELLSGHGDFSVLSAFAAKQQCAERARLQIVLSGGPGSYYPSDSLVVLVAPHIRGRKELKRVGIDRSSTDHAEITRREFSSTKVSLLDVPYRLIPELITAGEIEGAAWHRTTRLLTADAANLVALPLEQSVEGDWWQEVCSLAVIARRDSDPIRVIFDQLVDSSRLESIQADVIVGKTIPIF